MKNTRSWSNEYSVVDDILICKLTKGDIEVKCKFDLDMQDLIESYRWNYNKENGVYATIGGKNYLAREIISFHAKGTSTRTYFVNDNELDLRSMNIRLIRSVKKEKTGYYKLMKKRE